MFYYICGILAYATPNTAVIDAGGVGYKMTISQNTFAALPRNANGSPATAKLYSYMAVREDGIELFGFISETELSTFKMLLTVSGVGPKAAISILSLLTPEKFALAVCTEDRKTISKASGIGPKTAARIILELKDKLVKEGNIDTTLAEGFTQTASSTNVTMSGKLSEAQDALMVLGYTRSEAQAALRGIDVEKFDLEGVIKQALKQLMK